MAKKIIIKGVGQLLAKRAAKDGKGVEIITCGTLSDIKFDLNTEMQDIFGGDGLFAIDSLVTGKSIEVTATDAKFDLAALQLMMGSTVEESVESSLWVLNEQKGAASGKNGSASVAAAGIDFGASLYGEGNFGVRLMNSNTLLKQVPFAADTEPDEDSFMVKVTAGSPVTAQIILNSDYVGSDITFNYQRSEKVDKVSLLSDEVPFPVHLIHHGSYMQKDGKFRGIETELYQCRARGTFSINNQRSTASASQISLTVLDPERADRSLGSIKVFEHVAQV